MAIVAEPSTGANPTVAYARLYGALEGYLVCTAPGTLYFVDHDAHVYDIATQPAQGLTLLGAVPAVERGNVLAALAQCEETR